MGGRGALSGVIGSKNKQTIDKLSARLPQLEGSAKQVAWAEDIRQNYIRLSKTMEEIRQKQIDGKELTQAEDNHLTGLDSTLGFGKIAPESRENSRFGKSYVQVNDKKADFEAKEFINRKYKDKIGFNYFEDFKAAKVLDKSVKSKISKEYNKISAIKQLDWRRKHIKGVLQNKEAKYWIDNRIKSY